MRNIISVEYEIPGFSDGLRYSSDQSLLDADIIVFQPERLSTDYGKPSFDESTSFELQRSTEHWRTELGIALKYGKTVFLILGKYQVASIYTGRKESKGRVQVNYVREYSNYEFLPVSLPTITAKKGTEIVFTGDPVFATFWNEFNEYLTYESYFNEKVKRPVFVTKTGERPIGAVFKVEKGHLVSLPLMNYSERKFVKKRKDGESYWTTSALTFGRKLASLLVGIDKSLRSESAATPPPAWVASPEFLAVQEQQLSRLISDTREQIQALKKQEQSLQADLKREQQLKDLLFETGKPLEAAVILALEVLGYSAENYKDGELELDQIILSPEGNRFIGECEGKDSSAVNIDKLRQLEENIQADLQREEVTTPATGILFGNGFRLTPPKERPEQFTEKCLSSAKRGAVLVRTMDLYPVARYIQEAKDQAYSKLCRDAILAGTGRVVEFPPIPNPV